MTRRGRLFRKYVTVIVALVGGALLASGLLEIYFSYQENKDALIALQREKAVGAAARIETFIKEIERQMGWTTQPLFVAPGAALEQRRIDYFRLQRQVLPITEVSYLDASGKEQLRLSRLAMEVMGSQIDFSKDPRFTVPKSGRPYYGPVEFRKGSEPYMTIALPVAGGAGVTVAEVNLKFIWDVINQIKIGQAGRAFVVDGQGTLIAHPDISLVLQKTSMGTLDQITVVFLDLRGFTAFAETAEPEEVMDVLREYHAAKRFTGDGMMVFFNDPLPVPDPAERALRMALAMRERVTQLTAGWKRRGWDLGVGVGIAQGYATIGAIGFEGRWDYGAIGTVTNLAARLCGEAKAGQILISQRLLGTIDELVECEPVGELTLKGFQRSVTSFNVLSLKG